MAQHLGPKVLFQGEMEHRRIDEVCLVARNVSRMVD